MNAQMFLAKRLLPESESSAYRARLDFFRAGAFPAAIGCCPGLGRSAASKPSSGSVLMTSFFSSQPRRAVGTPYFIRAKFVVACASVEMTTLTPRSLGEAQMDVLEIEAIGIGVAFHDDAVFARGVEDFFHVVVEGSRRRSEAAGGMREDLGVGIFDGGEDAFGHRGAIEIHVGVDGDDHDVELGEDFVVEVERAVFQNVDFACSASRRMPPTRFLRRADFLDLLRGCVFRRGRWRR